MEYNMDKMLGKQFKHKYWFIGSVMTNKQFLDYVLYSGDFMIKKKYKSTGILTDPMEEIFYLSDRRYSMKLSPEQMDYLSERNNYFKSELNA